MTSRTRRVTSLAVLSIATSCMTPLAGCGGSNTPFGEVRPCSHDEEACKPVGYSEDGGAAAPSAAPSSSAE